MTLRVAIIHYWLINMRGGEKVIESLCKMFPQADIYTHVLDESAMSETIKKHNIYKTSISRLPFSKSKYQNYLPLMPGALESLDLSGYDLIISSESGPAKGVITPPGSLHICYCHSPMRYIWDQYHTYKNGAGALTKIAMPMIAPWLRQWDVTSAARVDKFVANSSHVAKRIKKYWRRDANIIYPPVYVEDFTPVPEKELEDYYLWVGELAPYKRPDLMIEAFNQNGKKLVIIGGPEKTKINLQKSAKENIVFLGKTDFKTLKHHMARCKALIFPGEEDFGIVPVEVLASGRPVIAFGRGGALDTIIQGESGLFFQEQTVLSLNQTIEEFETTLLQKVNPEELVEHAKTFSESRFQSAMKKLIMTEMDAIHKIDFKAGQL